MIPVLSPSNTPPGSSQTSNILVYITGRKPLYAPIDSGCQAFLRAVAEKLPWPQDKFLQYRPAGSRSLWMPLSVDDEFARLLKTCLATGVLVRVVPDNWFESDGQDDEEEVCAHIALGLSN